MNYSQFNLNLLIENHIEVLLFGPIYAIWHLKKLNNLAIKNTIFVKNIIHQNLLFGNILFSNKLFGNIIIQQYNYSVIKLFRKKLIKLTNSLWNKFII